MARRRGRKRRAGRRERSGRLARSSRQEREQVSRDNAYSVAREQPHRKKYGDQFGDWRAENELGRLYLDKVITQEQFEAGNKYREIVGRMRRAISAPRAVPKSSAGTLIGPTGTVIELDAERADRARSEYADAYRSLSDMGRDATLAVNDVVIEDRNIYEEARAGIFDLKAGLNGLVNHFGLAGRRRA